MNSLHSLPDIIGDGSPHPLTTLPLMVKWVQFQTKGTNTAVVRIGGAEVSATVGYPVPAGSGQMVKGKLDLSQIVQYSASGDVLYVLYGL